MDNFAANILKTLIAIARADGKFDPSERAMLRAVQRYLGITDSQLREFIRQQSQKHSEQTDSPKTEFDFDSETLSCAFYLAFRLAIADGHMATAEAEMLVRISVPLDVDQGALRLLLENSFSAPAEILQKQLDDFVKTQMPEHAEKIFQLSDIFQQSQLKNNNEQIVHNVLIITMADGNVCEAEKKYIASLVKSSGISRERFDAIAKNSRKRKGKFILHGTKVSQLDSVRYIIRGAMADGRLESSELKLIKDILLRLGVDDSDIYRLVELLSDNAPQSEIDRIFEKLTANQARREGLLRADETLDIKPKLSNDGPKEPANWTKRLVWMSILAVGASIAMIVSAMASVSGELDSQTYEQFCSQAEIADHHLAVGQIHMAIDNYKKAFSLIDSRQCNYQQWRDDITYVSRRHLAAQKQWQDLGYAEIEQKYNQLLLSDFHSLTAVLRQQHSDLLAAIDKLQNDHSQIKDTYILKIIDTARGPNFFENLNKQLKQQLASEIQEKMQPSEYLRWIFLLLGVFGSLILLLVSFYHDMQVKLLGFAGAILTLVLIGFIWWAWHRWQIGSDALKIWAKANIWTMLILGWFVLRFFHILSTKCPCCGTYLTRDCVNKDVEYGGVFSNRREYTYNWMCCRCEYEWTTMSVRHGRRGSLLFDILFYSHY